MTLWQWNDLFDFVFGRVLYIIIGQWYCSVCCISYHMDYRHMEWKKLLINISMSVSFIILQFTIIDFWWLILISNKSVCHNYNDSTWEFYRHLMMVYFFLSIISNLIRISCLYVLCNWCHNIMFNAFFRNSACRFSLKEEPLLCGWGSNCLPVLVTSPPQCGSSSDLSSLDVNLPD